MFLNLKFYKRNRKKELRSLSLQSYSLALIYITINYLLVWTCLPLIVQDGLFIEKGKVLIGAEQDIYFFKSKKIL